MEIIAFLPTITSLENIAEVCHIDTCDKYVESKSP